jgi:type I restriction enzyme S subunit
MVNKAKQLRIYDPSFCIVFCKTKERFGGLSNMAPGFPLCVNGCNIRTSEALYQSCRFPHIPKLQRQIINQHSPITAKMIVKPFKDKSRPDWLFVRIKIMRWCLRLKLAQNWHKFSELLLATGNDPIVELSTKDDFWGAKLVKNDKLVGSNILGRLLMELRENLKATNIENFKTVESLFIPKFLLFQQPISTVFSNLKNENPGFSSQQNNSYDSQSIQPNLFKFSVYDK